MGDKPLSVAIAAVIKNGKLLMMKRERGDYVGYWGLPGGKIAKGEHVSDAGIREIEEESGIRTSFNSHLGLVSEHLIENGEVQMHFLLHVLRLDAPTAEITKTDGGEMRWFPLSGIMSMKDSVIPSDLLMIEHMVLENSVPNKGYYECVLEKNGEEHILRKFS